MQWIDKCERFNSWHMVSNQKPGFPLSCFFGDFASSGKINPVMLNIDPFNWISNEINCYRQSASNSQVRIILKCVELLVNVSICTYIRCDVCSLPNDLPISSMCAICFFAPSLSFSNNTTNILSHLRRQTDFKLAECFLTFAYPWHACFCLLFLKLCNHYKSISFITLKLSGPISVLFFWQFFLSVCLNKLPWIWFNLNSKQGEYLWDEPFQANIFFSSSSSLCAYFTGDAVIRADFFLFWSRYTVTEMRQIKRVRAGWKVLWDKFNLWIFYTYIHNEWWW